MSDHKKELGYADFEGKILKKCPDCGQFSLLCWIKENIKGCMNPDCKRFKVVSKYPLTENDEIFEGYWSYTTQLIDTTSLDYDFTVLENYDYTVENKEIVLKEFKVNNYIVLKLIKNSTTDLYSTEIYVNNEPFIQCKYLLLNLPTEDLTQLEDIQSIDDVEEKLSNSYLNFSFDQKISISPEEEFKGHCSNIHAWAENGYNTCLLHSNLAFPLLKKLTEVGEPLAKKIFKEEIARRFLEGTDKTREFLWLEKYHQFLSEEEIQFLLYSLKEQLQKQNIVEKDQVWYIIANFYLAEGDINTTTKYFCHALAIQERFKVYNKLADFFNTH